MVDKAIASTPIPNTLSAKPFSLVNDERDLAKEPVSLFISKAATTSSPSETFSLSFLSPFLLLIIFSKDL